MSIPESHAGAPALEPHQLAVYHQDRRPSLYAALIVLLVVNNTVVCGRLVAHYYEIYRHEQWVLRWRRVLAEDYFMLLSGLFINVMIGNLLASTGYGLGLHSWRINHEDENFPRNLSNAFKHVWITMVFTAPTFTWIKLGLLFFYRRLFLVSQRWLMIAWWANLVYVLLWLVGATGFYLFQCWPVQWYYMRYYSRYHRPAPYEIEGQCNATNVTNVSRPLIFGLISDVGILLLPVFTIFRLHMSLRKKFGLSCVFSIGVIACATDMARIIELSTDTDDIVDPAYGVVIFLILSVATATAATTCACLPIILPVAYKAYKRSVNGTSKTTPSSNPSWPSHSGGSGGAGSKQRKGRGFTLLGDDTNLLNTTVDANGDKHPIELTKVHIDGGVENKGADGGGDLAGQTIREERLEEGRDDKIQVRHEINVRYV